MQGTFVYIIISLLEDMREGYILHYLIQLLEAPVSEGLRSDGVSAGHLRPKRVIFIILNCGECTEITHNV